QARDGGRDGGRCPHAPVQPGSQDEYGKCRGEPARANPPRSCERGHADESAQPAQAHEDECHRARNLPCLTRKLTLRRFRPRWAARIAAAPKEFAEWFLRNGTPQSSAATNTRNEKLPALPRSSSRLNQLRKRSPMQA